MTSTAGTGPSTSVACRVPAQARPVVLELDRLHPLEHRRSVALPVTGRQPATRRQVDWFTPRSQAGLHQVAARHRGAVPWPRPSEDFIYVRERRLPYETFDSDNHLYENEDALTKFLPKKYQGVVRYVDVSGRTKLALRDKISQYIPNPTFSKVAAPGSWGNTAANRGQGGVGGRTGVKPKVMPSPTRSSIPSRASR